MAEQTTTNAHGEHPGRHDFDFIAGSWHVANRRLADRYVPGATRWEEFEGRSEAEIVLGGYGNVDRLWVPQLPGGGAFEGYTLRLFDPTTGAWAIHWSSTVQPGVLDTPVVGRFTDGVGRFATEDVVGGRPVHIRFTWDEITGASARWRQELSWDAGATWALDWTMTLTRVQAG